MSSTNGIYTAAGAMNAFSTGMASVAHNVANVNTAGFEPQKVVYVTGPQGEGVRADVMPPPILERDTMAVRAATESVLPPEALDPSGTDLGREFTTMISTQRAYEANTVTVRAWDEMLGRLVDLKA